MSSMSTGTGSRLFSLSKEDQQLQEDLHDLAVVAERREEPTVGFSEFRKRYEQ